MGNCLTTTTSAASKRVQSSDNHLLAQQAGDGAQTVQYKQQHLQNLTDSEPHEFQYREIEHSMTHNSNLNAIVPSSNNSVNSSPKHRPMFYGNANATANIHMPHQHHSKHGHDDDGAGDLQRQIDVLKQCSDLEIKHLKSRIQTLEQHIDRLQDGQRRQHSYDNTSECKQSAAVAQCTKNTPLKSCPNLQRIVSVSKSYTQLLVDEPPQNEVETLRLLQHNHKHFSTHALLTDYAHILEVHCSHNNLFELRMVYLDVADMLQSSCRCRHSHVSCAAAVDITMHPFAAKLHYLLNLVHCYLSHSYEQQQTDVGHGHDHAEQIETQMQLQRLRDIILDRNDHLMRYRQLQLQDGDSNADDVCKLKISLNPDTANAMRHKNTKIYSRTPPVPVLLSQHSQHIVNAIGHSIPIDPTSTMAATCTQNKSRHDSVHSVVSNASHATNNSASKSSRSVSRSRDDENDSQISALSRSRSSPIHKTKENRNTSTIEMSEERVRRLSGTQMSEQQLRQLIDAYDDDNAHDGEQLQQQPNADDDEDGGNDAGLVQPPLPSSDHRTTHNENDGGGGVGDSASDELNEHEREEIEDFKSKLHRKQQQPRRGSKHNLFALQHREEWDEHAIQQTAQDMKMQLLHLALNNK